MKNELVELVGREIYNAADIDPIDEIPEDGAVALARRVLDRHVVHEYDGETSDRATVAMWNGKQRIAVPRWLPPTKKNWTVAYHLGRIVLGDSRDFRAMTPSDQEQTAASLAGWLTAPPQPMLTRIAQVGLNIPAIAKTFTISQSACALRLPEVTDVSVALVVGAANDGRIEQKPHVHRRGRRLSWLHDEALHELARKSNPKSVKKAVLRDAPKRAVLIAGV